MDQGALKDLDRLIDDVFGQLHKQRFAGARLEALEALFRKALSVFGVVEPLEVAEHVDEGNNL